MTELNPLRSAMARVKISTIAELAERANLGAATVNRAMYESGTAVHLKTVIKLADALGLTAEQAQALITEMRRLHRENLATQAQAAERAA